MKGQGGIRIYLRQSIPADLAIAGYYRLIAVHKSNTREQEKRHTIKY